MDEFKAAYDVVYKLRMDLSEAIKNAKKRGAFFYFFNRYKAKHPGTSGPAIVEAYKQAKAWTAQGAALAQYAPSEPFDPELAHTIRAEDPYAGEYGMFRTQVGVRVKDLASGSEREFSFWVKGAEPPTMEELIAEIQAELEYTLEKYDAFAGKDLETQLDVSYSIVDFAQFR